MAMCCIGIEHFTNGLLLLLLVVLYLFWRKILLLLLLLIINLKLSKTDKIWNMEDDEDLFLGKIMHWVVPRAESPRTFEIGDF